MEVGLEVNSEKTKYVLMSRKKAGQKHSIKKANTSMKVWQNFKYLGKILTDKNCLLPFGPESFVFPPAV
jgi:hypothetical protein